MLYNIWARVSQILTNRSLNLCNNSDQTLFSNTLTFARSLGRCWAEILQHVFFSQLYYTSIDQLRHHSLYIMS